MSMESFNLLQLKFLLCANFRVERLWLDRDEKR